MKFESLEEALKNPAEATELLVFDLLDEFPDVTRLVNLRQLTVTARRIRKVPASIAALTNLESLCVHGNMIDEVADEITRLSRLKDLDLSYNNLQRAPDLSGMVDLERLDLSYNPMADLPGVPYLKELILVEGGWIDPDGLLGRICRLTSLEVLHLEEIGLKRVPPEIGDLTRLRELNLRCGEFSRLPDEIGALKNLKELRLGECQDLERGITGIPEEQRQRLRRLLPDTEIEF